eukprot:7095376-Pyramimonas_sp.AAC.1
MAQVFSGYPQAYPFHPPAQQSWGDPDKCLRVPPICVMPLVSSQALQCYRICVSFLAAKNEQNHIDMTKLLG